MIHPMLDIFAYGGNGTMAKRKKSPGDDLGRLAVRLGAYLSRRGLTLATAESCTGGWIAKAVTDVAGSSAWYGEGFITYSNEAKQRALGVPRTALARAGAVSEPVARAMARGALARSGADLAVAVTGIAGPRGAVPGKPRGTVWLCWAWRDGRRVRAAVELRHFRGDRVAVRRRAVRAALRGLLIERRPT